MSTVHYMMFGMTACLIHGPPSTWPDDHRWDSDWANVTCAACLAGKMMIHTFIIGDDGKSITCRRCNMKSFSPSDIEHHWCGYCKVSHDDIWPPARKSWIEKRDIPVEPS